MMKSISILCAAMVIIVASPLRAEEQGVTKDTIKVGTFTPTTGPAANFGKVVSGAEALYKEINDHGGINGRKFQIIREDDACDPTRGMAAVKKLISQDQVFLLHGGTCTNVVMAARDEIIRAGIPFIAAGAAGAGVATPTQANIFQPVAASDVVARTMGDFAMSKPNTTKIAIVSHSDEWGKSYREPAVAYLKSKYNITPALDMSLERGSSDSTPQVLQLRQAKPDFILAMLYPAEIAIFLRDMNKYGLRTPTIGTQALSIEDTRDRVGSPAAVDNLYVFYPLVAPLGSPDLDRFTTALKKYYPNETPETISYLGMAGALASIEAFKKAGPDLTREAYLRALNSIRDYNTGVGSAPIGFSPEDHAGIKSGAMITFVNGKATVIQSWQPKS